MISSLLLRHIRHRSCHFGGVKQRRRFNFSTRINGKRAKVRSSNPDEYIKSSVEVILDACPKVIRINVNMGRVGTALFRQVNV